MFLLASIACLTPEVLPDPACTACHGSAELGPAPPAALGGLTDPSYRGVGGHERHLAPATSSPVACTECHLVPGRLDTEGHVDTPWPAEVGWSESVLAGIGAEPYDSEGLTCFVYCHGATLAGGSNPRPLWTGGPAEVGCDRCHGNPPPPPHPVAGACGDCHAGGGASNPEFHVDGTLQLSLEGLACDACHGSEQSPAPPVDTSGSSDTALRTVGAHETHVSGTADSRAVPCGVCHQVPATVGAPGHLDPAPAEVEPAAGFDGATCTNACHTGPGASVPEPEWTRVDGTQARCGACHGRPPPPPHPDNAACGDCHPAIGPDTHVDGTVDF